ncbi:hypothetical protein HYX17_01045 [Candidatus Woesearchaeota archaeon]|nr:hypothetical protein [Candidatus Woesearchaeota archaeon]
MDNIPIVNTFHALQRYDERAAPKKGMPYRDRDRSLTLRINRARLISEKEKLFEKLAQSDKVNDGTLEYREDITAIFILRHGEDLMGTLSVREPEKFYTPNGIVPSKKFATIEEIAGVYPTPQFWS